MPFEQSVIERLSYYTAIASWGGLCMVMTFGKFMRYRFPIFRELKIPASLIGGAVSCALCTFLKCFIGTLDQFQESWDEVSLLLLSLLFASLFLSLQMPKSFMSVFHEGVPQLIYAQVICWGEYLVAILVGEIMRAILPSTPRYLGVMVALGFEGGWPSLLFARETIFRYLDDDVVSLQNYADAASVFGLTLSLISGLVAINLAKSNPLIFPQPSAQSHSHNNPRMPIPTTLSSNNLTSYTAAPAAPSSVASMVRQSPRQPPVPLRSVQGMLSAPNVPLSQNNTSLGVINSPPPPSNNSNNSNNVNTGGGVVASGLTLTSLSLPRSTKDDTGNVISSGISNTNNTNNNNSASGGFDGNTNNNHSQSATLVPPSQSLASAMHGSPAIGILPFTSPGTFCSTPQQQMHQHIHSHSSASRLSVDVACSEHDFMALQDSRAHRAYHSLGVHLGLVTLASSMAYLIELVLVTLDVVLVWHTRYHLFANIPIFSLTMITCHFVTKFARRFEKTRLLNRHLFGRICTMLLEFVVIVDLAVIDFRIVRKLQWDSVMISFFVILLSLMLWNAFAFFVLAKHLTPNHHFARALAESSQAMGLTWTGLLFIKIMDPSMTTPVAMAYASKQLIHNLIMSGGVWSTHVLDIANSKGIWATFGAAWGGMGVTLLVYYLYARPRMPSNIRNLMSASPPQRSGESSPAPQSQSELQSSSRHNLSASLLPSSRSFRVPSVRSFQALSRGPSVVMPYASPPQGLELPTLIGPSAILHLPHRIIAIMHLLPFSRQTCEHWQLVYGLREHGASLNTLYRRCDEFSTPLSCLFLIEDSWGHVFGAYLSCLPLKSGPTYIGDGDTVVFTFEPKFTYWGWTGTNSCFMVCRDVLLAIGGPHSALSLDANLEFGRSETSPTFGNSRLASGVEFRAVNVEVWALM